MIIEIYLFSYLFICFEIFNSLFYDQLFITYYFRVYFSTLNFGTKNSNTLYINLKNINIAKMVFLYLYYWIKSKIAKNKFILAQKVAINYLVKFSLITMKFISKF